VDLHRVLRTFLRLTSAFSRNIGVDGRCCRLRKNPACLNFLPRVSFTQTFQPGIGVDTYPNPVRFPGQITAGAPIGGVDASDFHGRSIARKGARPLERRGNCRRHKIRKKSSSVHRRRNSLTCKRLRIINTLRLPCIDVGTALGPPCGRHNLAIILGSQKLLQ
jgi:hypothetical protein